MPAMDGWETSYIIRKKHESKVIIGIVSANAFDKGLENSAEISEQDFILKPVNVGDLLDWIGLRLNLEWISQNSVELPTSIDSDHFVGQPDIIQVFPSNQSLIFPAEPHLQDLRELTKIGYMRGILKKLDDIASGDDQYGLFVTHMRQLAERFQLDAMTKYLNEATNDVVNRT